MKMRSAILLLLLSSGVLADDFSWAFRTDSDSKAVLNLDKLPHDYLFEFWFAGDGPVLTKDKLIEAIETVTHEKLQLKRPCAIDKDGVILNYPCLVLPARPVTTAQNNR
jgi:hypothetical protein